MYAMASSVAELAGDREIVFTRVFDAPREMVFDAWTDPQQVAQWWGPVGFTTAIQEMDVREGGVWRHVMHGPNGMDFPNQIVFTKVIRPELLAYAHSGGRKGDPGASFHTTVTFQAEGSKTLLTMRMVFEQADVREHVIREYRAVEGGMQTLERLAGHLTNHSPRPPHIHSEFNCLAQLIEQG